MTSWSETGPRAGSGWLKAAALILAVAAVGLPVNDVAVYALLLVFAVAIFTGEVSERPKAWLAAVAIVVAAFLAQSLLAPPRIDEGHNVFLPGAQGEALQRGLPPEVHARLAREFDALYPAAVRCEPSVKGCWQSEGKPDRTYAFSADSIWHRTDASRSVSALDFSNPVWLHLGFINEARYNWLSAPPDVHRDDRDRRFFMGWKRWHLAMPWFEMIRLPGSYVGGELCWRGEIMWEGEGEHFSRWPGEGCRTIEAADAGRRVFGIAIKPDTLAMQLMPPLRVWLQQLAIDGLTLAAVAVAIVVLVRLRPRRMILPLVLIGLAVAVIAIDDASFLGGVRPFDGGDDGLFYDGVGRDILRHLLAGDFYEALRGNESVFWYGGPGMRYFRALEHIVFGETYLGLLSLTLLLPMLVLGLFRRFLSERFAIALALVFVAIPVGALFGTSFIDYSRWAGRGFADPAAYILFVAALLPLFGKAGEGPSPDFTPALFSGLLFALAVTMKPIVAAGCAVVLGGAGLAALYQRQWRRLAGLCIGFLPVFGMLLHNYVFGGALVLFSSNMTTPFHTPMPPSAYLDAARELLSLHLAGAHVVQGVWQIVHWLSGPAQLAASLPLHAAAIGVVLYVGLQRRFDRWLRLIALAALCQHIPALFYAQTPRYYYLAWLLTALVCAVWAEAVAGPWLRSRYPIFMQRLAAHRAATRLASGLARLQRMSA